MKCYIERASDPRNAYALIGSFIGSVFGLSLVIFAQDMLAICYGIIVGVAVTVVMTIFGTQISNEYSRSGIINSIAAGISIAVVGFIGGTIFLDLKSIPLSACMGAVIVIMINLPIAIRSMLDRRSKAMLQ